MTDYERACAVEDYLGLITVGPGHGLVLGDEPMSTAWWPFPKLQGGILVRWRWASEGASIIAALKSIPDGVWAPGNITLSLPGGQALLFDAAEDAATIEASLSLTLAPGTYRVDTADYVPDPETALLLHRLVPE
jgi:hypothetical protein